LTDTKTMPVKVLDIMKKAESVDALTPAARALRWVWNHEEVTMLLSGMSNRKQLDENIATADTMTAPNILGNAELETVDKVIEAFNAANRISCTGCGYCIPCPAGVSIPGCFTSYNYSYTRGFFKSLKPYVMATAALTSTKGLASSCTGCGKCEPLCPQNIPIIKTLKTVSRRLEPFWFKAGIAIARIMTSIKSK